MPRILRCYSNSNVYHIILKGIDNQDIFYDDQDRRVFLKDLLKAKNDYNLKIYAFCLMDNHIHLVIKSEKEFLSKSMQSLTIKYVHYFNKKYKRTGSLLLDRFKSKNIEDQRYFLEVCRYVHRNPENAGICRTEEYAWSSFKEYVGQTSITDTSSLLHYFNNDIDSFIKYTTKNDFHKDLNELAEYELIRKLSDIQLANIITEIFHINDVNQIPFFFKTQDKDTLKDSILKMKMIKGTNKTQLARIIRINKSIIQKIWA